VATTTAIMFISTLMCLVFERSLFAYVNGIVDVTLAEKFGRKTRYVKKRFLCCRRVCNLIKVR
jgi:hypothetical protein